MTWLDERPWHGSIYSGGWVPGSAGERAVVAPATGAELGRIGMASPDDVAKAAVPAGHAQRELDTAMPAYAGEVFGPVAPVVPFGSLDEAAALAAASDYGLSLGILTRDVMKGLELADRIPTGIVHINDQTVNDEALAPFGGVGVSGSGARFGGAAANVDAFTETRWVTVRGDIAPYPF